MELMLAAHKCLSVRMIKAEWKYFNNKNRNHYYTLLSFIVMIITVGIIQMLAMMDESVNIFCCAFCLIVAAFKPQQQLK